MAALEILYEDADLIAINKPHGLLVHKSARAADVKEFAVQLLRDQIGQRVYPVHRLDRKTSGVLLFAKNPAANRHFQQMFMHRQIDKTYLALVRGYAPEEGIIDYPLKEGEKSQEAQTKYRRLRTYEIPWAQGKFSSARYSLVELTPLTGRYHQLRKHMAHIFHPIIGDRPHGCNKQNRLWLEKIGLKEMLLHASLLVIPFEKERQLEIKAPMSKIFQKVLSLLDEKPLI